MWKLWKIDSAVTDGFRFQLQRMKLMAGRLLIYLTLGRWLFAHSETPNAHGMTILRGSVD